MKQLDAKTLESIAKLICGDTGPLYRTHAEIDKFFVRALGVSSWPDFFEGSRNGKTCKMLQRLNSDPYLRPGLEEVLLRLADPREYGGERKMTEEVVTRLNKFLSLEGVAVELVGAAPRLVKKSPELAPERPETRTLQPPDFQRLGIDPQLAEILRNRWQEAQICTQEGAHLSALVMMGSILEGALLAKIEQNKAQAFRANAAPKDKAGNPKPAREWGLSSCIDVAHELGWLGADSKRFSHALRDSRNLIHPYEQLRSGESPDQDTCTISWEVVQAAIKDLANKFS